MGDLTHEYAVGTGPLMAELGNALSDAINAALTKGMETDEACSIAMRVIGDYWRFQYGDEGIDGLGSLLRAAKPCECYRCLTERNTTVTIGSMTFPITATRMVVCDTCGNKRCPHGTDHRLACTDSNEPGQVGSCYA
jgi:hypothetical protein